MGWANPRIGERLEPKTGLIWATLARLKRLKDSATRSKCRDSPKGKYFRMRRSRVTSGGVSREFLPKPTGRAESGNASLTFESKPVNGSTGRPLSAVKIGATSM